METECGVNVDKNCAKCNILSSLLEETVTELKWTQLIIKLLQDDLNKLGDSCVLMSTSVD
jgi:hypothetical protein